MRKNTIFEYGLAFLMECFSVQRCMAFTHGLDDCFCWNGQEGELHQSCEYSNGRPGTKVLDKIY